MSSLKFPDTGTRLVVLPSGAPAVNKVGTLYADRAGTTLAEVYADSNGVKGALIADGKVTLDAYGQQPDYWGPADGTDRLYITVNGGPLVPVDADYNARIDTAVATAAPRYTTQTKTASFTAGDGFVYLVDSTAGAVVVTLPAANVAGQQLAVKWSAGANAVTVQRSGSDTIGSAATSAQLALLNEIWEFVSSGSGQWNLVGGNKTLSSLDGRYLQLAGGTLTGNLTVGDGTTARAVSIPSSFAGGENTSDSTGRINLYSYQRAQKTADDNVTPASFGEVIRIYSRRWDSKQMIAWYGPTTYDPTTHLPVGADTVWFWMGAHYEANDHGSVHGHWSVEVPDSTGQMQTRLEMRIWDPTTGNFGLDIGRATFYQTHLAINNGAGVWFDYNGDVALGLGISNVTPVGRLHVTNDGSKSALYLTGTADGTASLAMLRLETFSNAKRFFDARVAGDGVSRIRMDYSAGSGSGTISFGNGTVVDVNLYRAAPSVLKTDTSFVAGARITAGNSTIQTPTIYSETDGTRNGLMVKATAVGTATLPAVAIETTDVTKRAFDYRLTGDTASRIRVDANGNVSGNGWITFGDGSTTDVGIGRTGGTGLGTDGHFSVKTAGKGLRVAEGSNAKQGTATLTAGTVTVANTAVTATSRIFLTIQAPGGSPGSVYVSARTAGTSFTITSTSGADTSTVAYEIFEVG